MASSKKSSNSFTRSAYDPNLIKKARNAYELTALRPDIALQQIQELCDEHSDIGLLFRTQAEILEKCYEKATLLDKKERIMGNAIQCAKSAIRLSPNSLHFQSYLGFLYLKTSVDAKDYVKAIDQFERALNISKPSDPAEETLLTDQEIDLMSPTYEGRIAAGRKGIQRQIGCCLFRLKELKEDLVIERYLAKVKVEEREERLNLVWLLLNPSQKRSHLEEHCRGPVPTTIVKKDAAATGTAKVERPLKLKQPIVDNQESDWDQTSMTRDSCSLKMKEPIVDNQEIDWDQTIMTRGSFIDKWLDQDDVYGTTQGNLAKQNDVGVPGAEVLPKAEYVEPENFKQLVQSASHLVIITGRKSLRPTCYVNHIVRFWRDMSKVLQTGPMAMILVEEEDVKHTISLFPERYKAVDIKESVGMTGSHMVVTTLAQLSRYIFVEPEKLKFDHLRFLVIQNFDKVFLDSPSSTKQWIFENTEVAQVILANSVYNTDIDYIRNLVSGPWKILDLQ